MSEVDATIPASGVVVAKADIRANFATIKSELEVLQSDTSIAKRIAFGELSMTSL